MIRARARTHAIIYYYSPLVARANKRRSRRIKRRAFSFLFPRSATNGWSRARAEFAAPVAAHFTCKSLRKLVTYVSCYRLISKRRSYDTGCRARYTTESPDSGILSNSESIFFSRRARGREWDRDSQRFNLQCRPVVSVCNVASCLCFLAPSTSAKQVARDRLDHN